MPGILFVVATPLGNLGDFSSRGQETLRQVDLIACEDTRHTRKLLTHFGIDSPTISYHEHNEEERSRQLLKRLKGGERIALVSDAGTPLLSDPGFRLVQLCRKQDIAVIPIPGPCAAAAALSVSGLPTDQFFFVGFPANKKGARCRQLEELVSLPATLVFYVAPHKLLSTLEEMLQILGDRQAFLIGEMTKLHEKSLFGKLSVLAASMKERRQRGEYTLVVEGNQSEEPASPAIDIAAYVEGLMRRSRLSRREAVRQVSRELGLRSRDLYKLSLSEKTPEK